MKRNNLALIILMLIIPIANAIPIPQGIDGTIYELDGLTQVPNGIDFYVQNEATGQMITGKINSGMYSVSLGGATGDLVTIKTWNKYNQANISVNLNGVMRNVNLLLNMTYPPIEPIITSIPQTNALEGQAYIYDMESYDENQEDILAYSIIEGPASMTIESSTGLVSWIPNNNDVGTHNIILQVTDGIYLINQSFDLDVANVNDQPIITSVPIENATIGRLYIYDVEAYDPDGEELRYSLTIAPKDMQINLISGVITWTPKKKDRGNHLVVVSVGDNSSSVGQSFTINVQEERRPRTSAISQGTSSFSTKIEGERKSIITVNVPIEDAAISIADIERPIAKRLEKVVYKYLSIENDDPNIESLINFTVDRNWLLQNQINPTDIVLARFHNGSWKELKTINIGWDGNTAYYSAKTPGFSFFAISVKEGIRTNNIIKPVISKIQVPFRFSGIVYKFAKLGESNEGRKIIFENLDSGKVMETVTGQGPHSGAYYVLLEGDENDDIKVSIEGTQKYFFTKLKDTDLDFMLNIRKNSFTPITENFTVAIIRDSLGILLMIGVLALLVSYRLFRIKRHKK